MIHPFMPFISEEIWQHLPHQGDTITLAAWPEYDAAFEAPDAVGEMSLLMDMIRAVRNIRAEVNVPMSKRLSCSSSRRMRNMTGISTIISSTWNASAALPSCPST